MATQLNIKDQEAIRLAREIASRQGKTVTAVVREALENEWKKSDDDRERRKRDIKALAAEFRRNMPAEWRGMTSKEIMDSIYNEDGSFAS
jgi:hypothetical protein